MSPEEALFKLGFGLICDVCNMDMRREKNVYYVASLNELLCKECCDDFIGNIDRYPEDAEIEERLYNSVAERLDL